MRFVGGVSALAILCALGASAGNAKNIQANAVQRGVIAGKGLSATSAKWGFWAKLTGSSFQNAATGTVNTFYWVEPNRVLEFESVNKSGLHVQQLKLDDRGQLLFNAGKAADQLHAEPDGTFVVSHNEQWRTRYSFDGRFLITNEKLQDGKWVPVQTHVQRRLEPNEVGAAKQQMVDRLLAAKNSPGSPDNFDRSSGTTSSAGGARFEMTMQEAKAKGLSSGATVEGVTSKEDRGYGFGLWRIACFPIQASAGDMLRVEAEMYGERSILMLNRDCKDSAALEAVDNAGSRSNLSLVLQQGREPLFVQVYKRGQGKRYKLTLNKMTPAQVAEWKRAKEQARQAEIQRNQSNGGDNVFGRALGGALMGAMLGGGGQNSVDLAVAGAQAAANGGNTYQVLSSMGDVAAANAAESERQLNETIARAQRQGSDRPAQTGAGGIVQDTHGPLPEGDQGEGSIKVVTRESVSQSRKPSTDRSCPFEPVVQATGCDGFERVKVYGHFKGISNVSLEAAKAQAFEECSKAGKECTLSDTYVADHGPYGGYYSAEVAYWTGEYRRVSKGPSAVSSQ